MAPEPDLTERDLVDASRRTYLAAERTYLAWYRSGLAALAVSMGVGRLVPSLIDAAAGPFVALGVGFALLGLFMVVFGAVRQRAVQRGLRSGTFVPMPDWTVLALAFGGATLAIATIVLVGEGL